MSIIGMQRRLREVGRIRIGEKKTNANGKTFPGKLSTFRFTTRDRTVIDAAATLFGGEVSAWASPDGSDQWQVTTQASELEVIVPPADMAFSQFYELWSGGGCVRRCDGENESIGDTPCVCDPEARECDPHSRLSLIIPDLPIVGLFRLDTSGWNAAVELAGAVDLAREFAARGKYLPAELRLEIREKKRPGEPTKKFAVPCLDLKVSMRELTALGAGPVAAVTSQTVNAIGGNATAALSPGPSFTPVPASLEQGPSIAEQVAPPAPKAPRKNAAAPIPGSGKVRRKSGPAGSPLAVQSGGGESGPVVADAAAPTPPPKSDEKTAMNTAVDKQRASTVALWCKDAGFVTDDERHEFLHAYNAEWASSYDVTTDDLGGLRNALKKVTAGELVMRGGQLVKASDHLVSTTAGEPVNEESEPF